MMAGDPGVWLAASVVLDLLLGGAAAASVGRALARGWRSFALAPVYMTLLAAAVGFLHYAIFNLSPIPLYDMGEAISSLPDAPAQSVARLAKDCVFWAALTCLLTLFALLAYRLTRRAQMTQRYGWRYERAGMWSWRERQGA